MTAAMTTTTHYAAVQLETATVYGIGTTPAEAEADAAREFERAGVPADERQGLATVPCSAAAAEMIGSIGGAPSRLLSVSRSGVTLADEEE